MLKPAVERHLARRAGELFIMPDLRYTEVDAECDQLATVELSRQHARCNVRDNVSYSVEQKICLTSVFEEVYEKVRTLVLKISEFTSNQIKYDFNNG